MRKAQNKIHYFFIYDIDELSLKDYLIMFHCIIILEHMYIHYYFFY